MPLKPYLIKVATRNAIYCHTEYHPSASLAIEHSMQRYPDSRRFSAKPAPNSTSA